MVTKSLPRGQHVTIVLSEANRDSDHFGGHAKSLIVSKRFDLSRSGDSKRLHYDAITRSLTFSENEFLLLMTRRVVDAFLPPSSDSKTESHTQLRRERLGKFSTAHEQEEKWMKLMLHAQTLLLGSAVAIVVGIFARKLMPISRNLPDVIIFRTILYAFIFANVLYAISVLAKAPALSDHGIVFISFSTLRFFLVGRVYFEDKGYFVRRSERSAKSLSSITNQKYRYPYSTASALLQILFHLWLLFLQYCVGHQNGGGLFFEESLFQIGQGMKGRFFFCCVYSLGSLTLHFPAPLPQAEWRILNGRHSQYMYFIRV